MPQMSPLKWLILFSVFSIIYMLMASTMYFNLNTGSPSIKKTHIKTSPANWKW